MALIWGEVGTDESQKTALNAYCLTDIFGWTFGDKYCFSEKNKTNSLDISKTLKTVSIFLTLELTFLQMLKEWTFDMNKDVVYFVILSAKGKHRNAFTLF